MLSTSQNCDFQLKKLRSTALYFTLVFKIFACKPTKIVTNMCKIFLQRKVIYPFFSLFSCRRMLCVPLRFLCVPVWRTITVHSRRWRLRVATALVAYAASAIPKRNPSPLLSPLATARAQSATCTIPACSNGSRPLKLHAARSASLTSSCTKR